MLSLNEILIFVFPVLLYFFAWREIRDVNSLKPQLLFWSASIFLLFLLGWLSHESENYTEITSIGNGILYAGSIILLGPALMFTKKTSKKIVIGLLLILLPFLGIASTFLLLLVTGQISGA